VVAGGLAIAALYASERLALVTVESSYAVAPSLSVQGDAARPLGTLAVPFTATIARLGGSA